MADSVRVTAEAVSDFLDMLHVERGLATATIEAYARDLRQYLEHLDGAPADSESASSFVAGLAQRGLAPSTISRKTAAVRGLHRHLAAVTGAPDPTALLESPRRGGSLPKALSVDETLAILAAPDTSTVKGRRDRALLEFLYGTGARVSEAVAVDELDLDLDEGTVLLRGKGDKERMVPIGAPGRAALRDWLTDRGGVRTARSGSAVFLSLRGRRMSRQTAWTIVRKSAERAGIPPSDVSPHVLRHSAATHMVEGGADLRSVQEILGHATIATTQIYTRVSPQHLLEVYTTSHPRS